MSMFHEVINSLWDYGLALQLNDNTVAREQVFAATLIADLIAGDIPEPQGYRQAAAANHPEREMWIESMRREQATLEEIGPRVIVPQSSVPLGHRPIRLSGTSLFTARSCSKTSLFRSSRGSSGVDTRSEPASIFHQMSCSLVLQVILRSVS